MTYNIDTFESGLEELGIILEEKQINQFIKYYEMLIEKNKVMNLTAITDYEEVIHRHFLDSLLICKVVDLKQKVKIIDVGTGAGFPGIPLKIAFPDIEIVLLDSLNKRIQFLNEVIESLDLKNIETIHGRAEDFAQKNEYREQFDYCVSRAVANLASLSEYCLPFVRLKGTFIPYKAENITEEVESSKAAIHLLGGKLKKEMKLYVPNTEIERKFLLVEKKSSTPKKYPRKSGLPVKNPLR